jgi:hypothetical protein
VWSCARWEVHADEVFNIDSHCGGHTFLNSRLGPCVLQLL